MNPSLILFDLDGTLVDTAPEIGDALNALLAAEGLPTVDQALVRRWIGHGTRELLVRALQHLALRGIREAGEPGTADALMPAFGMHYLAHCGRANRVYPQVEAALDALREHGKHLVVLSNKEERFAFTVIERHGLRDYFQLVIGGDTLPTRKPDPTGVQHCMKLFGADASQCLLVGDSEIDVATARAAGIGVWAVPWGYNNDRPIELAQPDRVILSFGALFELTALDAPRERVSTY
jgi:phosphoglycolate phosphatase